MHIGIPQIIFLIWELLGLGVILANHGKPKDGEYNFFITFGCFVIMCLVLWWGGFF